MGIGDIRFAQLDDLSKINEIWRPNSKTLGFYPFEAFRSAILNRNILVATDDANEVYGYLLFRIAKHRICITHLCVESRRGGIARKLNEFLVRYSRSLDLDGIHLYCRRDYKLQSFWAALGYVPHDEKPGRGRIPSTLENWIISHLREDLLTTSLSDDRIVAVLDTNILIRIDAHSDQNIDHSAKSLVADWLVPVVRFAVASEVLHEISRQDHSETRNRIRKVAKRFDVLNVTPELLESAKSELLNVFPGKFGNTENDLSDLNHLATAIATGASYFVTHDTAVQSLGEHEDWKWSLRVTDPTTLILTLDEAIRETEYSPESLSGTDFKICRVGSANLDNIIRQFRAKASSEKESKFSAVLRSLASDPVTTVVEFAVDSTDTPVFLWAKTVANGKLQCDVFRSSPNKLEGTVIRHMLSRLISEAITRQCQEVSILDAALSQESVNASKEFGFQTIPGRGLWKPIFYGRYSLEGLLSGFVEMCEKHAIDLSKTRFALRNDYSTATALAELETIFWPAKLITQELPTYIVPIRPLFAMELFDSDLALTDDLFGARATLALACENVYYRSKHLSGLRAPGRILWYVSKTTKGSSTSTMTIRGCSLLNEVVVDTAKKIFQRFKRLGVYEWRNIAEMVNDPTKDEVMALRFSHTELFRCPVELQYLKQLGITSNFQGPVRISLEQFGAVYDAGMTSDC